MIRWMRKGVTNKMEGPPISAGAFESVNGLEAVEIGVALETEFLNEADGDPLIDQIVLRNAYPKLIPWDRS